MLARCAAVALALCSCAPADVVVGRNFDAQTTTDAGDDAGPGDAGSTDAGVGDAGVGDAGVGDAGAGDAGQGDAGAVDGGTDGGGLDAGPPDLVPFISGTLAVELGDTVTWAIGVFNDGGLPALDAGVRFTVPLGMSFVSLPPPCLVTGPDAGACALGDVAGGAAPSTAVTYFADGGAGWRDLQLEASTSSAEASTANNTTTFLMALTPVGVGALPIVAPRRATLEGCFGMNLTSFMQCTPGGLITSDVDLLAGGDVDTLDAGYAGVWGQAPHRRNLAMRFFFGGTQGARYAGAAVDANCFEGVIDYNGMYNAGAFRLCLQ